MNQEDLRQIGELLDVRFAEQDRKLEERFNRIDDRLDEHDRKFEQIDKRFGNIEKKIELQNLNMERGFAEQNRVINQFRKELKEEIDEVRTDLGGRIDMLDNRVETLDRKIDMVKEDLGGRIDIAVYDLKLWMENRYDPAFQALREYLPPAAKTYADLEDRVDVNTIRITDCCTSVADHETRIKRLEVCAQEQKKGIS